MKPNDNSEIFLNALISQIQSHLQTVGGVYITTATIAPSPIPIPGMANWTGYSMDEQFDGTISNTTEELIDGEAPDGDDGPSAEIGETKRILGKVPIGIEMEEEQELSSSAADLILQPNPVIISRKRVSDMKNFTPLADGEDNVDNPPVITTNVGITAPPRPPGSSKEESNGRLDTKKLARIDSTYGSGMLHIEAANQYDKMLAQAIKDKIVWRVSSTYRDIAGQIACYEKYGSGSAAKPGSSPHGWGLAMDFGEICGIQQSKANELGVGRANPAAAKYTRNRSKTYNWLSKNGPKYGWYNPYRLADGSGMDEAWHWEYWGFYTLSEEERKA